MKILFLVETLQVGGAETSLLQILPRLSGVRPVMCHIYSNVRDHLKPAYESRGIPVVSLDLPPKYRFVTACRKVHGIVRRERPDLIVTTLYRADIVGRVVGKLTGIPVVSSFVSDDYSASSMTGFGRVDRLKRDVFRLLDLMTAPWVAHFLANSEAVKRSRAPSINVSLDRVSVIHRGRDLDSFGSTITPDAERAYRESLGVPASAPVVLNVGRLVEGKGQGELIEAFARLLKRCPDAMLLIAGEGPFHDELGRRIQSRGLAGHIRLLGRRDDVPALLAIADVFAFPSRHEGHPGAVVEAMAAARPIVVSDIPVHREMIIDGHNGRIVPVRRPEILCEVLCNLLLDREMALRLGTQARRAAMERYDINRITNQHAALYRRVVREYAAALPARLKTREAAQWGKPHSATPATARD
jgi:glycosyltransferase involved in cell wall biosynthesis